jgi:hypothetical protein
MRPVTLGHRTAAEHQVGRLWSRSPTQSSSTTNGACHLGSMDAFRRLGAVVIIEDIAALPRLDEIRKVDHIDVFLAAP